MPESENLFFSLYVMVDGDNVEAIMSAARECDYDGPLTIKNAVAVLVNNGKLDVLAGSGHSGGWECRPTSGWDTEPAEPAEPADNASVTVEIDEADQVDPPDVLMERFTDATTGRSDIDPHEVLWDILTDVRNMFKVSMAAQGVTPEAASRIDGTVLDTLTKNYGEE